MPKLRRRLQLAAGTAVPLLAWMCMGPGQSAVPAERVQPAAHGQQDPAAGAGSGSGAGSGNDAKNPQGRPGGLAPDFGTFTPPPQGDSDDTPALASASLAAVSLGGAAFVLRRGRRRRHA